MERSRRGLIAGILAGLAVAGAFVTLFGVLVGGEFSFPPTCTQCVEFWNGPRNEASRRRVAEGEYALAVVEGWEAQGVYGYCSIAFLGGRSGGRWASYVSWVSGQSYPGARRRWSLGIRGQSWDVGGYPVAPDANASVHQDGSVTLLQNGA